MTLQYMATIFQQQPKPKEMGTVKVANIFTLADVTTAWSDLPKGKALGPDQFDAKDLKPEIMLKLSMQLVEIMNSG